MAGEHERQELIRWLQAHVLQTTGRRYPGLNMESMSVETLRELKRLLRDLEDEHAAAVKRARLSPWKR